jgi:hypothetical protein
MEPQLPPIVQLLDQLVNNEVRDLPGRDAAADHEHSGEKHPHRLTCYQRQKLMHTYVRRSAEERRNPGTHDHNAYPNQAPTQPIAINHP